MVKSKMKTVKKVLFFFFLLLCISCINPTVARLGFSYLEAIVTYRLDDYFDINDNQEEFIEEKLKQMKLKFIREDYHTLRAKILQVKKKIASFNDDDIILIQGGLLHYRNKYYEWGKNFILDFLVSLDDEQVNFLEKEWIEQIEEDEEKATKPKEKRISKLYDKVEDNLEDYLDYLTEKQEKIAMKIAHNNFSIQEEQLMLSQFHKETFISALTQRNDKKEFLRFLNNWFLKRESFYGQKQTELKEAITFIQEKNRTLYAEIFKNIEKNQIYYIKNNLDVAVEVIDELYNSYK